MTPLLVVNDEKKLFFVLVDLTMLELSNAASEPVNVDFAIPAEHIQSIAQRIQELTGQGYKEATEVERRDQDSLGLHV